MRKPWQSTVQGDGVEGAREDLAWKTSICEVCVVHICEVCVAHICTLQCLGIEKRCIEAGLVCTCDVSCLGICMCARLCVCVCILTCTHTDKLCLLLTPKDATLLLFFFFFP